MSLDYADHNQTQNTISHNLHTMAQQLQDKIELEFKSQMNSAKEDLKYMQKEMTDKFK